MSIQYFEHPLAAGIQQAGSALGGALQERGKRAFDVQQKQAEIQREKNVAEEQRMRQSKTGGLIQQGMDQLGPEASLIDRLGVLGSVLEETGDLDTIKQYGTLMKSIQGTTQQDPFGGKSESELSNIFQKLGMDEERANNYAALYPTLSVAGRTAFAKTFFDEMQRSSQAGTLFGGPSVQPTGAPPQGGGLFGEDTTDPLSLQANVEPGQSGPEANFAFPAVNPFEGLTAKEKVKRQGEISKDNLPLYNESVKTVKASKIAERTIRRLDQLNNTGKLPTGAGKIVNVNYKTGDLRVPSLANKETQLFVKTVNEFLKGAKEIFGARVTNFELDRFMQGLPTLANTEEGRRVILKQMAIVNQMHQLENDSIKEVYNKYGLRNIDPQQAQQIADRLMAPKEAELNAQFDRVLEEVDIYEAKEAAPRGQVAVEINGQRGYVPKSEVDAVKGRGGVIL